jgi:hypothetical protein
MTRDRFLLILLVAWGLAMIVPDLVRFFQPLGSLGFYANSDGLIYDVTGPFKDKASSPASKAGIHEGDRIDLSRMRCLPYEAVRCGSVLASLGGLVYVLPGRVAVIDLAPAPGRDARTVTIVAAERPADWVVRIFLMLDAVAGTLVVCAAAWLVWKRPGRMSWGFFLYAFWFNPGQSFVYYAFLQQWPIALLVQNFAAALAQAAGYAGLLLFALHVPNGNVDVRWRALERLLPLIGVVFALGLLASYSNAFGFSTETVSRATLLGGFAVDLAALLILLARRRGQSPEDYQRVRWVIWGCAIGLPAFIVAQLAQGTSLFSSLWSTEPPYDLVGLLFLVNGVFCLFVVQALSRDRVVSVLIPLRRVTLLGLMLSAPALLLHHEVEDLRERLDLPEWAWLGIAVLALYAISRLHELAVHLADRYLNRGLDRAESALGQAILRATRPEEIDRLLADEPFKTLSLSSAATFRRTEAAFVRHDDGNGWDGASTRTLAANDPILAPLSNGVPFGVADASTDDHLPPGLRRPILAIPVASPIRSFAVALYGPHAEGTDLDGNERAMLARLGKRAADCYAHLETAALRKRIATLEGELAMRASGQTPEAA